MDTASYSISSSTPQVIDEIVILFLVLFGGCICILFLFFFLNCIVLLIERDHYPGWMKFIAHEILLSLKSDDGDSTRRPRTDY